MREKGTYKQTIKHTNKQTKRNRERKYEETTIKETNESRATAKKYCRLRYTGLESNGNPPIVNA